MTIDLERDGTHTYKGVVFRIWQAPDKLWVWYTHNMGGGGLGSEEEAKADARKAIDASRTRA